MYYSQHNWIEMAGQRQHILFCTSVTCLDPFPVMFMLIFVQITIEIKSR